ncbi:flagellar assembly protein FliW [Ruminiclostridium cellobioparum]|jgi:flagellar assembly factor FliW|uniref:flagellar assembly protein FliW n=1 Tax=Ruminiclostridium cellobioparum TaxID=29355 RepID=UPI0028A76637|nr:flagellar assembly protein FliW [Ruminiclostridium cellobioparum]
MFIETTHFGKIEIDQADILNFEEGIIGFEDVKQFGIIDSEDPESPFKWIQAIDKPELAFALVDPFKIKKDYDFDLKDEAVEYLGVKDASELMVFSIVVVPEDIKKISMNLKAPLIINRTNNKAAQIILDTDEYTVRHFILDELQKQEV